MTWRSPLHGVTLKATDDSMSWKDMAQGETGIPLPPHPGAYGVQRKNHIHEGVDLYCPVGTLVVTVEPGRVVAVIPFTGEHATPPSPWWHNTWAVLIEGESGVVLYGEIDPWLEVGQVVGRNWLVGRVQTVLKEDKGRPMSMLHLELHEPGTTDALEWVTDKPKSLLDPTKYLLELVDNPGQSFRAV